MREQKHTARWTAWAALVLCALMAAYLGLTALFTLEWQGIDWQDSRQFRALCQDWNDRVATAVADSIALESDTISYVERQQLEGTLAEFEADVAASETNYRFRLLDRSGEELSSNLGDGESLLSAVDHIGYASFVPGAYAAEELDSYGYYAQYYGWTVNAGQETTFQSDDVSLQIENADGQYILEYGVAAQPEIDDSFYQLWQDITRSQGQFAFRVGVGAALLLAALASLICLLCLSAGEGCVPTWQEKIYLEVYLLGAGAVDILLTAAAGMACQAAAMGEIWSERAEMQWQADLVIAGGAAAFAGAMLCTALLLRTLAVRLHTGTLGRTSLLCRGWSAVYRGVGELVRQLPLTWRTIAGFFRLSAGQCPVCGHGLWRRAAGHPGQRGGPGAAVPVDGQLCPPAPGQPGHRRRGPELSGGHRPDARRPAGLCRGPEQHLHRPCRGGGREDEERAL